MKSIDKKKPKELSKCCNAEVKYQPTISGDPAISICQKCHTPCDVIKPKEKTCKVHVNNTLSVYTTEPKFIDYAKKLCLYGKVTEQHAKDINEILNNHISDITKKVNQAHWNWPDETDILKLNSPVGGESEKKPSTGKPKELEWVDRLKDTLDGEWFCAGLSHLRRPNSNIYDLFELHIVDEVKDIISSLLLKQKEQIINEILVIVDKGIPVFFKQDDDISENNPHYKAIRYYLDELRSQIKKEIKNLYKNEKN